MDEILKKLELMEKYMQSQFQEIHKKIDNINDQLQELKDHKNDNKLEEKLENIEDICSKMSGHIDFVEDAYTTLKNPLSFVKRNVEKLMGKTDNQPLPELKRLEDSKTTLGSK